MLTWQVILSVVVVLTVILVVAFKPLRSEFEQWRASRRVSQAMRRGVSSLNEAPVRVPQNFGWQVTNA